MKNNLLILLLLLSITALSQEDTFSNASNHKKQWFVSAAYGMQMSGIKDEDFISKNVAPAVSAGVGVWFTPEIALQLSYKGPHFNTIADDDKHPYYFIFGEVLLNMNEIYNGVRKNKSRWSLIVHPGAGYFYNTYYNQLNVCGNLGLLNKVKIRNHLDVFVDISFIVGWDIYQGDDDILPSAVLGLTYSF